MVHDQVHYAIAVRCERVNHCGGDCCAICDFCSYYDEANVHCKRHDRPESPEGTCEHFHCIRNLPVAEVHDSES